jgi:hypothetical protein
VDWVFWAEVHAGDWRDWVAGGLKEARQRRSRHGSSSGDGWVDGGSRESRRRQETAEEDESTGSMGGTEKTTI